MLIICWNLLKLFEIKLILVVIYSRGVSGCLWRCGRLPRTGFTKWSINLDARARSLPTTAYRQPSACPAYNAARLPLSLPTFLITTL